ncbi:protein containing Nitrite and sulphite reductase 4Fe-4S region domain protein, partial [gut metagenome]
SRLPMIQISGCPNSCARHQAAEIGFAGRKVRVGDHSEDAFQLFVGGSVSGTGAHLGALQGVMFASVIPQYIVELGQLLEQEEKTVSELVECRCFKELTEKFLVS